MKRERAKELLPIIQAYAEGKKIQFLSRQQQLNGEWIDVWYDCIEPCEPNFFEQTEYRIKPEYNEIFKLKLMLEGNHIPFEWIGHNDFRNGYQICYPEKGGKCVCSVIEHSFSYGSQKDLLEIQGLLTEEEECDSVLGNLTATDVFQRILSHWKGTKEKTTYRPFKSCDELIETWKNMMNKVLGVSESFIKTDLDEPTVWVKQKIDGRRRMIVGFGENFVEVGNKAEPITLERLFEMYTFFDGRPCGVSNGKEKSDSEN